MEQQIYIYALKCPLSNEIRYIGKSHNPKRRYREHLKTKSTNHKSNWINSLLKQGLKPLLEIIETCTIENWCEREKYHISQHDNLTNGTIGGEDGRMTDEVRQRMSIINTGENNPCYGKVWNETEKLNLSVSLTGRKLDDTHKANLEKSANKKEIYILGIEYPSIMAASKILGIKHGTLSYRINSNNYPDYIFK